MTLKTPGLTWPRMKNQVTTRGRKSPLAGICLLSAGALLLSACGSSDESSSYSIELNTDPIISVADSSSESESTSQSSDTGTSDIDGDQDIDADENSDDSVEDDLPDDPILRKYVLGLREGTDLTEVLSISEIMAVVEYLWSQNENNSWYCKGYALALSLIPQWISSSGMKVGDDYFSEQMSYGFVPVAARAYQTGNDVTLHTSTDVDVNSDYYPTSASWGDSSSMTSDEYAADWGWDLTHFGNYFFGTYTIDGETKSTIITEEEDCYEGTSVSSASQNDDGTYTVFINLDTVGGVANYKKQMKTLSSLDDEPTFYYSLITYTLDAQLNPISASIHEYYQAKMTFNADTEATMEIAYFPGQSPAIPEIGEDVDYTVSGLF